MRSKKWLSVIAVIALVICMIAGTSDIAYAADYEPGTYTVSVSFSGGSGRAGLAPTGTLIIEDDGYMEVIVSWIKTNGGSGATQFAWMKVNGATYYPISGQTFQFPITAGMLDNWIVISALTEAMSQPHEIDYNMMISSAGIPVKQSAEPAPSETQPSQPDTKPADQPTQPDTKPADQPTQPDTKPADQPQQPDPKPDVAPAPVTQTNTDSNTNPSDSSNTAPGRNTSDNYNNAADNTSNNAATENTSNNANNAVNTDNSANNVNNTSNNTDNSEKDQTASKNNTVIYIAAAFIVAAAAAAVITTKARKKR